MIKTSILYLFITLSGFYCLAQEKSDTLNINSKYQEPLINPFIFDIDFFNTYYPLSGDFIVNNRMSGLLYNKQDQISKYQVYSHSPNTYYQYYSNGYCFWQNDKPLLLGASIHLNELFDWDKLDIFLDAQGGLYNVYDYNEKLNVFETTNKRAFSWNASAGMGYKVSKGSTIFIKSSVSFDNLTPVGSSNFGGMNMKF